MYPNLQKWIDYQAQQTQSWAVLLGIAALCFGLLLATKPRPKINRYLAFALLAMLYTSLVRVLTL
jgi:hypothetical protein